jgi:hypothetical protein
LRASSGTGCSSVAASPSTRSIRLLKALTAPDYGIRRPEYVARVSDTRRSNIYKVSSGSAKVFRRDLVNVLLTLLLQKFGLGPRSANCGSSAFVRLVPKGGVYGQTSCMP